MWKLLKAEIQYSIASILTLYGGSVLLLSLVAIIVALIPNLFVPDDVGFFILVLFWAMMFPQFMSLGSMSKRIKREKRELLIFTFPLTARDYIFGVWITIILFQAATLMLGISFVIVINFVKNYSLFNTVLGLNGFLLAMSGMIVAFQAVAKTTRWFKPFSRIIGIVFIVIFFGGQFFFNSAHDPLFTGMFSINGIIFLHFIGVIFLLASYSGLKRISPIK